MSLLYKEIIHMLNSCFLVWYTNFIKINQLNSNIIQKTTNPKPPLPVRNLRYKTLTVTKTNTPIDLQTIGREFLGINVFNFFFFYQTPIFFYTNKSYSFWFKPLNMFVLKQNHQFPILSSRWNDDKIRRRFKLLQKFIWLTVVVEYKQVLKVIPTLKKIDMQTVALTPQNAVKPWSATIPIFTQTINKTVIALFASTVLKIKQHTIFNYYKSLTIV